LHQVPQHGTIKLRRHRDGTLHPDDVKALIDMNDPTAIDEAVKLARDHGLTPALKARLRIIGTPEAQEALDADKDFRQATSLDGILPPVASTSHELAREVLHPPMHP
jgi:hypothetical protein